MYVRCTACAALIAVQAVAATPAMCGVKKIFSAANLPHATPHKLVCACVWGHDILFHMLPLRACGAVSMASVQCAAKLRRCDEPPPPAHLVVDNLPSEIKARVCSFLRPRDAAVVMRTSKSWYVAAADDDLWKALCFADTRTAAHLGAAPSSASRAPPTTERAPPRASSWRHECALKTREVRYKKNLTYGLLGRMPPAPPPVAAVFWWSPSSAIPASTSTLSLTAASSTLPWSSDSPAVHAPALGMGDGDAATSTVVLAPLRAVGMRQGTSPWSAFQSAA
ncbi:F-box protein [archaeon]|nr:MAG: F-box protein [archaeon]